MIRDSLFTNLAHGADATVIAINSSLTIQNTTFASNSQAAAGALFLNGSSAVIYDSLFDHNRGARFRSVKVMSHRQASLAAIGKGTAELLGFLQQSPRLHSQSVW